MDKKIVVAVSGGMDSATLLGLALSKFDEVFPVSFTYGSKHNYYENQAARDVCKNYGFNDLTIIDLTEVAKHLNSNLLKSGGEIPEGHYEAETMTQTVVPGRNSIFISIMVGIAESRGYSHVGVGVHAGDHAIYPDCRAEYITAMDEAMYFASGKKVSIYAPFLRSNKADILKIGYGLHPQVPYFMTRTCYKDQPVSCGRCGSCQERLEAFKTIDRRDPIPYIEREILPKED